MSADRLEATVMVEDPRERLERRPRPSRSQFPLRTACLCRGHGLAVSHGVGVGMQLDGNAALVDETVPSFVSSAIVTMIVGASEAAYGL